MIIYGVCDIGKLIQNIYKYTENSHNIYQAFLEKFHWHWHWIKQLYSPQESGPCLATPCSNLETGSAESIFCGRDLCSPLLCSRSSTSAGDSSPVYTSPWLVCMAVV